MIQIPEIFEPLFSPKRYKILMGGRGSGKSTSIALALLIRGMQSKTRILCAREVQNSISDSVHKLLKDLVSNHEEFAGYEVLQNIIRYPNGSEFIFKGLKHNVNDIKSTEGVDVCWVEEAQAVSADSWDVLVPTIRAEGSEIWISFNPHMEDDPTYQRFVLNGGDDTIVVKANYDANPFLSDVLRAEMERDRRRDFNAYLHIWEGEFKKTTDAAVFKNWRIEEFEAPKDAQFLFGADWGFSNDPMALVRLFIVGEKLFIDQEAFGVGVQLMDLPSFFEIVEGSKTHTVRCDNSRPEIISMMRNNGYNTIPAMKWAGSVEDGVEWLKNYDIYIHPRCKNIINEFSKYSYKVHRLTNDVLPEIVDADNHGVDAIRYAIQPIIKANGRPMTQRATAKPIPSYSAFARR